MIHLVRCKDVRIAGISILHSPSWNINPYACERMVIDGIYIYSSPKDAVWADGIDPDGCKDLRICQTRIDSSPAAALVGRKENATTIGTGKEIRVAEG